MDRRQFLTIAALASAAVFLPELSLPEHRQSSPAASALAPTKVYCGSSVNANGRFRHYLVDGQRVTEKATA